MNEHYVVIVAHVHFSELSLISNPIIDGKRPLGRPRLRWEDNITRQAMCMKRNVEVRSCNYWCSWKVISNTYSECGSVALGIQYAMRMRHIVMWPARLYNIFPHYLINGTI